MRQNREGKGALTSSPILKLGGRNFTFAPHPQMLSHSKWSVIDKGNINVDLNCNFLYLGSSFQLTLSLSYSYEI